jgi:phosphoribosylformimino-5-aminoimidazole carboxamide ribotide isomerase
MIILPAIDMKDKQAVRLYQGNFNATEVVANNIIDTAQSFKDDNSQYIHLVDLDGAKDGISKNLEFVYKIIEEVKLPVELGGGIRNMDTIDTLINKGVSRVILGTAALNNPELVKEAVNKYHDKIAVGIDAKNEMVAVNGWLNVSNVHYIDFAKEMEKIGVKTIIYTDISRDGTLKGPNLEQLKKLQKNISCNIIASGGIKTIEDIQNLKDMNLYGAICGKSIYAKTLSLKEANKLCLLKE